MKLDVLWGDEIPWRWNHVLKVYGMRFGKQRTMGMGNSQYVQSEKQGSFGCVPDMSCQNRPKQYMANLILTQLKGTN